MSKNTVTVKLPFKKETTNMLQFQVTDEEKPTSAVPTIYVRKDVFPGGWPDYVEVTVGGVAK